MIREQFISIPGMDCDSEQIARIIALQLGFPKGIRLHRVKHTPPWQHDAVRIFHPDTLKDAKVSGKFPIYDIEIRRMFLDKGFGLIQKDGRFDLSRWQSTDDYILGTSERGQGFCMVELKDMIRQKEEMREESLANRFKKLIINVKWALTEGTVNYP